MDRIRATFLGHADDLVNREICRNRPHPLANPIGLVRLETVQRQLVLFRENSNRPLPHLIRSAHHTDRNLTTVRYQNLVEVRHGFPLLFALSKKFHKA
ncbi:hypothetical protein PH7735_03425 [Shimia thalassica]|uniref:Uncharacterized protein n=1 Tax=Shimia thalassica TaxID=1715693 RepID=A0A0P1IFI4_9RHOB|nr:hypothetical protein PH7735_03425 [Shimia thalassica]